MGAAIVIAVDIAFAADARAGNARPELVFYEGEIGCGADFGAIEVAIGRLDIAFAAFPGFFV